MADPSEMIKNNIQNTKKVSRLRTFEFDLALKSLSAFTSQKLQVLASGELRMALEGCAHAMGSCKQELPQNLQF